MGKKWSALVVPDIVAVAVVDPGGISGVARGIFELAAAADVRAAWSGATELESWEEEGTVQEQSQSIVDELDDWFSWCNIEGIAIPHLSFVIEAFQLRQRHVDLTPVQLTTAIDTMWRSRWSVVPIEYQQPAEAMTYATNPRLRQWGAWVRGSEHRRDANRHLLLRVSKLMNGL